MTEHRILPSGRSQLSSQPCVRGGRRTLTEISLASGPDPLVSVITVVRNGESTIARCIESVLAQTYANTEHIIVDGGSSDQTVPILRSYGDKISLWISEPDTGIYNALNKAIQLARGSHYIPLGCDDILLATGVESLVLKAKTSFVICGKVRLIDANKTLKSIIYNHSAGVLIDIRAHAELGLYDETYKIAADTKFLQLAARASYVYKIDEVVGEFAVGGVSSNYAQNVREHSRAMREAGSWSAVQAFIWRTPRILWSIFRS
jgi:glycosyltransferase involved in cell wall biosynthesis